MPSRIWIAAVALLVPTAAFAQSGPVLTGHEGRIHAVAFSPDGSTIATAGEDKTVHLWNVAPLKRLARLKVESPALCLAFSPDGRSFAVGADDRRVRVYSLDGRVQSVIEQEEWVFSLAFSRDGSRLITIPETDNLFRVWKLADGTLERTFEHFETTDYVRAVSFSPNGRLVASSGAMGRVNVWNLATGEKIDGHSEHEGRVPTVVFLNDDEILSGGQDQKVVKWSLKEGETTAIYDAPRVTNGMIVRVARSAGGAILAHTHGGGLRIWDESDSRPKLVVAGYEEEALYLFNDTFHEDVAFSPNGELLAVVARRDDDVKVVQLLSVKVAPREPLPESREVRRANAAAAVGGLASVGLSSEK